MREAPGRSLAYLLCALLVMALGLVSRRYGAWLPTFLSEYAGDTLWALLVFLGVSVLQPNARLRLRGATALGIAFMVEISQLYHAPWIDGIRGTTIGGLVLGSGFLWTDLVCYAVGVGIGILLDRGTRRLQGSKYDEPSESRQANSTSGRIRHTQRRTGK